MKADINVKIQKRENVYFFL